MSLAELISLHDREPVAPRYSVYEGVLASAYEAAEEFNAELPLAERVFQETVREIVSRETSEPTAYRAVLTFLSSLQNYNTNNPTRHTDLLPAGHPLGAPTDRAIVASYFATRPEVNDDIRPIVSAAISAPPTSAHRAFNVARLEARGVDAAIVRMISDADTAVLTEEN